jgi:thiol-disulfide isomerase/thioredoxin
MRQIILLLTSFLSFSSCSNQNKVENFNVSIRTVVTGKVINPISGEPTIGLAINRIGFGQEEIEVQLDSTGNFKMEFATYVPVDAWISYHTNFLVVLKPGDSLNVEFDASQPDRPEVLETIKFGGKAAETNRLIAIYQKQYFASSLYLFPNSKLGIATRNYEPGIFREFADSVRQEQTKFLNDFIKQYNPDEFVRSWATYNLYENYYDILTFYPNDHRKANLLKQNEWSVPVSYYDYFNEPLSIEKGLQSGDAISGYLNRYLSYMWRLTRDELKFKDKSLIGANVAFDSIALNKVLANTPQGLLRESMITYMFNHFIEDSEIELFENYKPVAENNIHASFLKEPLFEKYEATKGKMLKAEQVASNRIKSLSTFLNGLFSKNQGKVLYVDIWATWCGPCRDEFPYSKQLYDEFSDKVEFIYVCIDSDESSYKNALKKFQLKGTHYFFDKKQSLAIREKLEMNGVPFYILIDQDGNPVNRGYGFRPSEDITREQIVNLIKG